MSRPRFSIVIPTRERAPYLAVALQTCLGQPFDDFEVVVADNCSSRATLDVVESLRSQRVRYVRSDVPLAMSANWERGLLAARGEYVTVLGDDDGLLRHALPEADHLIRQTNTAAVRWDWVFYRWPDSMPARDATSIQFAIPGPVSVVKSIEVVHGVAAGKRNYVELPMLYNSFVRHDVLTRIRQRTGACVRSICPDIYSGLAVAWAADKFLSVARPMGIAGLSSRSTGESHIKTERGNSVSRDFQDLNAQEGLTWNRRIPHLPSSLMALVAETVERAHHDFYQDDRRSRVDLARMVFSCVQEIQASERSPSAKAEDLATLREFSSRDRRLTASFKRALRSAPPETSGRTAGFRSGRFWMDGREHGALDTEGVAALFERLFGCLNHLSPAPALHAPLSPKRIARGLTPPFLWEAVRALAER